MHAFLSCATQNILNRHESLCVRVCVCVCNITFFIVILHSFLRKHFFPVQDIVNRHECLLLCNISCETIFCWYTIVFCATLTSLSEKLKVECGHKKCLKQRETVAALRNTMLFSTFLYNVLIKPGFYNLYAAIWCKVRFLIDYM